MIVAVAWGGHRETPNAPRATLEGKIDVDCVNPVGFDKQGAYALNVPEGSAAQQAEVLLQESRVAAAFQHVSAVLLEDPEAETVDTDVMVLGDDRDVTDVLRELVALIPGMGGIYLGRSRNARQVEALTCNLQHQPAVQGARRYSHHRCRTARPSVTPQQMRRALARAARGRHWT